MFPIFLKIGPITIYYYGVFVFLGVVAGYFISLRDAERQGIDRNNFSNIVFWSLVFAFIGAKITYILIEFKNFLASPLSMLRTGFVFYGGVFSGFISLYVFTKKYSINFRRLCDSLSLGIPLAHALGRIGCFSYGCCYGRDTGSFIGMLFPPQSPAGSLGVKVIPTQLIESFTLVIIFIVLNFLKKYKEFEGQIFIYYLMLYAIVRFIIEFFRGDERGQILFLSVSQFGSAVLIVLSIFLWYRWKKAEEKL